MTDTKRPRWAFERGDARIPEQEVPRPSWAKLGNPSPQRPNSLVPKTVLRDRLSEKPRRDCAPPSTVAHLPKHWQYAARHRLRAFHLWVAQFGDTGGLNVGVTGTVSQRNIVATDVRCVSSPAGHTAGCRCATLRYDQDIWLRDTPLPHRKP